MTQPQHPHTVYARWRHPHYSQRRPAEPLGQVIPQSLLKSHSPKVAVVARMDAADTRSSTADNNRLINETAGLQASTTGPQEVREGLAQAWGTRRKVRATIHKG